MRIHTLAAVAAVLLAGCGRPIEAPPASPGTAGASPSGPANVVTVDLREWAITPAPASVPAGDVTLKIVNSGAQDHGLYVEGPGADRKGPLVPPGREDSLTLDLTPGEYNLFDFVKDNETARGMKAALTVK